ncbi:MAG: hypothetical protein AAFP90_05815, partial [Planctomycetota bacterium]
MSNFDMFFLTRWVCTIAMVSIACVAAAQRDLSDIPKPDPVREQMAMRPFDGAAVNLFAANPAISKPVQFN